MHLFPKEETDPQRRRKWANFVHKHRPSFQATKTSSEQTSVLHVRPTLKFGPQMNLILAKSVNIKRFFKDDGVSTIDVACRNRITG